MKYVLFHLRKGYLVDFDPFGKQEFEWNVDKKKAWVFKSERQTIEASRWMPHTRVEVRVLVTHGKRTLALTIRRVGDVPISRVRRKPHVVANRSA